MNRRQIVRPADAPLLAKTPGSGSPNAPWLCHGDGRANVFTRRSVRLGMIAAALGAAAILLWPESSREITNYPSQNKGIVAFGDSLVEGVGSKGGGFVLLLSKELKVAITNLGRSGDTTESALARVSTVTDRKPALTILLLGGNDFIRRVPRKETIENLERLISAIQASGSAVLLVGLDSGILGGNQSEIFEDLSVKYRTAYVPDILDGIYGNNKFLADPLHPNDAGYALMAERLLPTLKKLIE